MTCADMTGSHSVLVLCDIPSSSLGVPAGPGGGFGLSTPLMVYTDWKVNTDPLNPSVIQMEGASPW